MNYWVGVVTGALTSFILFLVFAMVQSQEVRMLQEQMAVLQKEHEELVGWVEENRTVMQTYKFFNQSWQAIIDLKKENK